VRSARFLVSGSANLLIASFLANCQLLTFPGVLWIAHCCFKGCHPECILFRVVSRRVTRIPFRSRHERMEQPYHNEFLPDFLAAAHLCFAASDSLFRAAAESLRLGFLRVVVV
jgi:hypothetical protein